MVLKMSLFRRLQNLIMIVRIFLSCMNLRKICRFSLNTNNRPKIKSNRTRERPLMTSDSMVGPRQPPKSDVVGYHKVCTRQVRKSKMAKKRQTSLMDDPQVSGEGFRIGLRIQKCVFFVGCMNLRNIYQFLPIYNSKK